MDNEKKEYEHFEAFFKEANLNYIAFDAIVGNEDVGYIYHGDNNLKLTEYGRERFSELLLSPCTLFVDRLRKKMPVCIIEGASLRLARQFFAAAAHCVEDSEYRKIFKWS